MIFDRVPFVSVVIPVKNEEKHIRACLKAVLRQTYNKKMMEVIIVDNGSTDNTISIIKDFGNRVKLYKEIQGTIARVRNFGAGKAKGDLIAFLDGDCLPDKEWLQFGVKKLYENDLVGCIGFTDKHRGPDSSWVQQAWQHICSTSKCKGCIEVPWLSSFNLILSKELFVQIKGFNESLETCEDSDLGYRIGVHRKLLLCDYVHVVHLGEPETLLDFIKNEYWRGKNNLKSLMISTTKARNIVSVLVPFFYLITFTILIISTYLSLFVPYMYVLIILSGIVTLLLPIFMVLVKSSQIDGMGRFIQVSFLMAVYLISRGFSLLF